MSSPSPPRSGCASIALALNARSISSRVAPGSIPRRSRASAGSMFHAENVYRTPGVVSRFRKSSHRPPSSAGPRAKLSAWIRRSAWARVSASVAIHGSPDGPGQRGSRGLAARRRSSSRTTCLGRDEGPPRSARGAGFGRDDDVDAAAARAPASGPAPGPRPRPGVRPPRARPVGGRIRPGRGTARRAGSRRPGSSSPAGGRAPAPGWSARPAHEALRDAADLERLGDRRASERSAGRQRLGRRDHLAQLAVLAATSPAAPPPEPAARPAQIAAAEAKPIARARGGSRGVADRRRRRDRQLEHGAGALACAQAAKRPPWAAATSATIRRPWPRRRRPRRRAGRIGRRPPARRPPRSRRPPSAAACRRARAPSTRIGPLPCSSAFAIRLSSALRDRRLVADQPRAVRAPGQLERAALERRRAAPARDRVGGERPAVGDRPRPAARPPLTSRSIPASASSAWASWSRPRPRGRPARTPAAPAPAAGAAARAERG